MGPRNAAQANSLSGSKTWKHKIWPRILACWKGGLPIREGSFILLIRSISYLQIWQHAKWGVWCTVRNRSTHLLIWSLSFLSYWWWWALSGSFGNIWERTKIFSKKNGGPTCPPFYLSSLLGLIPSLKRPLSSCAWWWGYRSCHRGRQIWCPPLQPRLWEFLPQQGLRGISGWLC